MRGCSPVASVCLHGPRVGTTVSWRSLTLGSGFARCLWRGVARSGVAGVVAFLRHAAVEKRDAQSFAFLLVLDATGALEGRAVAFRHVLPQYELLLARLDAALGKPRVGPQRAALSMRGSRRAKKKHEGEKARHEA